MLIDGSKLINCSVASLHMGGIIAKTDFAIVDPNELKVIAYEISGSAIKGNTGNLLRTEDVREFNRFGLVIDSTDELVNRGDVIKIDEILKLNFVLEGLNVVTKKGTKLGTVLDYTVDTKSFMIMQIIVKRPIFKAIVDPELVIGRAEIVEIDDYKIVIKDEEKELRDKAINEEFVPNFVNPFRKNPEPQTSPIDNQNPVEQDKQ